MDFSLSNCNANKSFRMLNIYERLNKGESLHKEQLANDFGVSLKTVQRDIDDLRAYLAETHFTESETSIKYDKEKNCYYLIRLEREWMTNEESLALCKILLESRAFCKEELSRLIEKLIMQIAPEDRRVAESIIRSEYFHYVPLKHEKKLLTPIWMLSQYITKHEIISFRYQRQDGKQSIKTVKPASIMFSEFYFYLIAFTADDSKDYPIVFRIDRITEIKGSGKHFTIDYRNKFNDGEFRKRVQFMYSGELKTVKFEYSGVLEAILDRLPTAKILKEENGIYNTDKSVSMPGLFIKNCHFKDIHTTRYDKKIIKKSGTFSAFLREKSVTTVSVSGCTGFENADSGSLSGIVSEPIKIFDDGTTIGAEYTSEDLLNSDVHQKIASGVSGFSKPEKSAVFKHIYSAISDFLEKETCGTPADKFKESDLDKIFSQFDVPSDLRSPTNLLGIYNGTISLKSELAGDFIGILFLKDRFYYKKTVASEITGMLYENIKSVGKTSDYSNSVYIDGENYESVVLKGNLYSSPEITSLFYKIYHEIERLK